MEAAKAWKEAEARRLKAMLRSGEVLRGKRDLWGEGEGERQRERERGGGMGSGTYQTSNGIPCGRKWAARSGRPGEVEGRAVTAAAMTAAARPHCRNREAV